MTIVKKQADQPGAPTWVFGYGSLIYKVDFPYLQREIGSISGWQRRFWQGSHDHRGTPEAPGRVVTLVPARNRICRGVAYLVQPKVFTHLDHREKNGYTRLPCSIALDGHSEPVDGVVYVADADNEAYMGPMPIRALASHIQLSHGPSGSNREYVLRLADSLRELGESDPHVEELESLLVSVHLGSE
ncbi:gamma-glutamylcyclotransferase [Seongchinamella unica]|uniref:glutathione-specific gamma-glutamylcyclotransferase n=1 Tax=Seongchinamella unica TaxID=2547392 RepID=A0A4R5LT68_9GAMM|nr:gamma-glutamylcyclotransferase [Seongchinamella unica]TDG14129.1 gamma-glutamylcyclotransferase [Seongchinamella unica]